MLSLIPKIFSSPASNHCQEGVEGDPGENRSHALVSLHCFHMSKATSAQGESSSFPKAAIEFLFPGLGTVLPANLKHTMLGGLTKKALVFYFLVIQINQEELQLRREGRVCS